jgi:hypothetical protein
VFAIIDTVSCEKSINYFMKAEHNFVVENVAGCGTQEVDRFLSTKPK